ncbi:TPA: hypothetical protein ACT9K3_002923 [Legionella pneumophila]
MKIKFLGLFSLAVFWSCLSSASNTYFFTGAYGLNWIEPYDFKSLVVNPGVREKNIKKEELLRAYSWGNIGNHFLLLPLKFLI